MPTHNVDAFNHFLRIGINRQMYVFMLIILYSSETTTKLKIRSKTANPAKLHLVTVNDETKSLPPLRWVC